MSYKWVKENSEQGKMDKEKSAYTLYSLVYIYIDYYYTHAYPKKDSAFVVTSKSENKNVYSHSEK